MTSNRMNGVVKWYDPEQGHGFLKPETPGPDVFVHHSAIHGCGLRFLHAGDRVEFEYLATPEGPAAEDVVRAR